MLERNEVKADKAQGIQGLRFRSIHYADLERESIVHTVSEEERLYNDYSIYDGRKNEGDVDANCGISASRRN